MKPIKLTFHQPWTFTFYRYSHNVLLLKCKKIMRLNLVPNREISEVGIEISGLWNQDVDVCAHQKEESEPEEEVTKSVRLAATFSRFSGTWSTISVSYHRFICTRTSFLLLCLQLVLYKSVCSTIKRKKTIWKKKNVIS